MLTPDALGPPAPQYIYDELPLHPADEPPSSSSVDELFLHPVATQAAEQHPAGDSIADVEQPLLPPGDADAGDPTPVPAPAPAVSPDKPPRPILRINSLSNLVQVRDQPDGADALATSSPCSTHLPPVPA